MKIEITKKEWLKLLRDYKKIRSGVWFWKRGMKTEKELPL